MAGVVDTKEQGLRRPDTEANRMRRRPCLHLHVENDIVVAFGLVVFHGITDPSGVGVREEDEHALVGCLAETNDRRSL